MKNGEDMTIISKTKYNATETEIRYAIAVCYLALIEDVEKYVRYEPDNPIYIRNSLDAKEMFEMAFKIL